MTTPTNRIRKELGKPRFTKEEIKLSKRKQKLINELGRMCLVSNLTVDEFIRTPDGIELCTLIDKTTKELYDLALSLGRKEEYEERLKRKRNLRR